LVDLRKEVDHLLEALRWGTRGRAALAPRRVAAHLLVASAVRQAALPLVAWVDLLAVLPPEAASAAARAHRPVALLLVAAWAVPRLVALPPVAASAVPPWAHHQLLRRRAAAGRSS